jgi:hypothetical protein
LAGSEQRPLDGSHTPALWHWSDAVQTVGGPAVQLPPWQLSPTVHASESALHVAPFAFAGFEQTPVAVLQVPASWHWSDAVQTVGVPAVQLPLWQLSPTVHALESALHVAPFVFAGFEQTPVAVLQVPASWHWSEAVQTVGVPAAQLPLWQLSPTVHALESALHVAPFGRLRYSQVPDGSLHVPACWHWSGGPQTTGFAPVQMPLWHVSVCVHALPSLQPAPFGFAGSEQTPLDGSQTPTSWHWSRAAHVRGVPAWQVPAWQVSPSVQALPSLQPLPLAFAGVEQMPVEGLQVPASWH